MKHDIAPWTRHEPNQPYWASLAFHPPEAGKAYKVRDAAANEGIAYFSYSRKFVMLKGNLTDLQIVEYWSHPVDTAEGFQ